MTKKILLAIILSCITFITFGQYQRDAWTISPKISFADYSDQQSWQDYSISKVPPVSIFVEKGINNFLSAGGFVGYSGDKYTNDTIPSNVMRYRAFMTGAVATIHYAHWIERLSGHAIFLGDFDFYISGAMQMAFNSTNEENVWNPEEDNFNDNKSSEVKFRVSPIFGIRYFITDRFCMLAEVGKGNPGMVTTGVTWVLD